MTTRLFRAQPARAHAARGVSLIEVLIAVLILAIGMLGVAALQSSALRNSQSSLERSQAVIYNYTILDAMRSNAVVARGGGYDINFPYVAGTCTIPAASATDLSANDRRDWLLSIQQTLGTSACGSVKCDAIVTPATTSRCVVTVRFDDGRGSNGNTDLPVAVVSQI
jgi:type IV pilus assembly protein PilV